MLCEVMKTMSSSVEGKGNNLQLTTYLVWVISPFVVNPDNLIFSKSTL